MTDITEMQLTHLYNVGIATKYGLVDRGFPHAYAKLAALGLIEKKYNGYIITMLGKETLKANRERLFGKNKKVLKREKAEEAYNDMD